MTSKQQPSRQSQNASSASSQSTTKSLIFSNISLNGNEEKILRNLKRDYVGVTNVIQLHLKDKDGKSIHAVRIDVKSDDLANQFLGKNNIRIDGKEYSIESLPRSFIVSKVASSEQLAKLSQDLAHNYLGIENISRFYDVDEKPIDYIRIDFKSDASPTKIIKDNYLLVDGKRCPIQPYWSLIYTPSENQNGKNHATEQPQKYLTEQRVKELFREQQMQLEAMINEFDNKWNARLSSLTTSSTNTNVDQLLPIINDLSMVCQQFNQQNVQLQRQLGSVVHRAQNIQIKLNNEQTQEAWPQLPVRNGH